MSAMPLFDVGREVIGPAFCELIDAVIARSHERGWDRLLFIAREGHLFREMYQRRGGKLPSSYLYLSRLATSLAAVDKFGERERALGLAKLGVDSFDGIEDRARVARDRLRRYLAQEGVLAAARPALVDIGWSGTIQHNLRRAGVTVDGIYFALKGDPPGGEGADRKEGVVADFRRDRGLPASAPFHFLELFEQAARADHGTAVALVEENGAIVPLLKEDGPDREAERRAQPAIAELQRGILACAGERARSDEHSLQAVRRELERFIFSPSAREIDDIAALSHGDDWGSERVRPLVAPDGPAALLRPRRWLRAFHQMLWKPAFVRRTGGPVAARLYHGYIRAKYRLT
jgi:hypothetical protein